MTLFNEIAGAPVTRSTAREAVVSDLSLMCGVRRGALPLAPEYGVDDVTFLFYSHPGGTDRWCARLEETLRKYEPRLRNVSVVPVEGEELDLTLRVEIQALMAVHDRLVPARFSAEIDAQSRLTVR